MQAYGLHLDTVPAYAMLNAEVDRIVFADEAADPLVATAVVLTDGTVSPVAAGGSVVLAASSLSSAAILVELLCLPLAFDSSICDLTFSRAVSWLKKNTLAHMCAAMNHAFCACRC